MAIESIPLELAADWKRPPIHAGTLAILQYTSGSLAAPKGVMVSHRNVLETKRCSEMRTIIRKTIRLSVGYQSRTIGD
jgi:acyl-CoA synthetase (AMP-forming)/AMP-acid ligase II